MSLILMTMTHFQHSILHHTYYIIPKDLIWSVLFDKLKTTLNNHFTLNSACPWTAEYLFKNIYILIWSFWLFCVSKKPNQQPFLELQMLISCCLPSSYQCNTRGSNTMHPKQNLTFLFLILLPLSISNAWFSQYPRLKSLEFPFTLLS